MKTENYEYNLTRVHKKQFTTAGNIWLVVQIKDRGKEKVTYTTHFSILLGTPDDRVAEMAEQMYQSLVKQYSLK